MALMNWALPQLSRLLPVDEDSLKQIITYSDTLPKDEAADHLKNLLGDSHKAFEFITSFNSRRRPPPGESVTPNPPSSRDVSESEVPRSSARSKKKKTPLNKAFQTRQPENFGDTSGGYVKSDESDYMSGPSKRHKEPPLSNSLALNSKPDALQVPMPNVRVTTPPQERTSKLPPSAAGSLISDVKKKPSRDSSPASKSSSRSKINVTGGTSMRGQSTTLNDLDSAIRALEMQTNPSLGAQTDNAKRKCNCMAQRHALFAAAPNCLHCGKVICAKEGLGPCTFCGMPLLSSDEIQAMVKVLKEERGKERQDVNNAMHKRAEVSKAPRPFSSTGTTPLSSRPGSAPGSDNEDAEKLAAAKSHRDRLLKFQADNARRTRIHDETADFETPDAGLSQWASPQERALQLKKQQKTLREQEWNARPEYEKRRMVVSLDVVGGKAVRRMADVERPEPESESEDESQELPKPNEADRGGTFSRNPLLGGLIRPVFTPDSKGKGKEADKKSTWRRVQDDNDDNEEWILDGGAYGDRIDGRVLTTEEHAYG